jgi:hypothetical protein
MPCSRTIDGTLKNTSKEREMLKLCKLMGDPLLIYSCKNWVRKNLIYIQADDVGKN